MATVRKKGNRFYYRTTVWKNGKYHYFERGGFLTYDEAYLAGKIAFPCKRKVGEFVMTNHLAELIFDRFPLGHPAHIPLKLIYLTGCTSKEAYEIRIDDVDYINKKWKEYDLNIELIRLLKWQEKKIIDGRLLFLYPDKPEYFNIYLTTGKRISPYQIDYVIKVIRKEINPAFDIRKFYISLNGR